MKVLILMTATEGASFERIGPVLPAETHHAWDMYKSGTLREVYFRGDAQGAVLILEASDLHEAEKLASELPLVKSGFAHIKAIPLLPFTAWESL